MALSGWWVYVPWKRRIHIDFDKLGKRPKIKEIKLKQRQVKAQHLGSVMQNRYFKVYYLYKSIVVAK